MVVLVPIYLMSSFVFSLLNQILSVFPPLFLFIIKIEHEKISAKIKLGRTALSMFFVLPKMDKLHHLPGRRSKRNSDPVTT